jgi:hypothetical protein
MGSRYNEYLAKIARNRSQEKAGQRRLDERLPPDPDDEFYDWDSNEPLPEKSE